MAGTSWRRSPMPPGWYRKGGTRDTVLERDGYRCRLAFAGCEGVASEVHHAGAHDNHRLEQLLAVCPTCHRRQTASDAGKERARRYHDMRKRTPLPHPGLTRPVDPPPPPGEL